jgi:hypothetical protein
MEELDRLLEGIEDQFVDATRDNPVKAVDFAKWLNPRADTRSTSNSVSLLQVYQGEISAKEEGLHVFHDVEEEKLVACVP